MEQRHQYFVAHPPGGIVAYFLSCAMKTQTAGPGGASLR